MVFVEDNCPACDQVLQTLEALRIDGVADSIRVVDRRRDPETWERFNVLIVPATFIDGVLAFYGEFTPIEAREFLSHEHHIQKVA